MTQFIAVPYEYRSIPGSDGVTTSVKVMSYSTFGGLDCLYVVSATQPTLNHTPNSILDETVANVIATGAGQSLWLRSPTGQNIYEG